MMKTLRAAWCAAVMAAWAGGSLWGTPPAVGGDQPAVPPGGAEGATAATAVTGDNDKQQYLLLPDGRLLTGTIRKEEKSHLVVRNGGAIPIPNEKVLCVADTLEEVYQFRVQRIAIGDISEHIKLSQWCALHDLFEQADAELVHVLKIDPGNTVARRRLESLRRSREPAEPAASTTSARPRTRSQSIAADPAGYLGGFTQAYGQKAFERFSVIEKRLLNQCGNCHASNLYTGSFKLFRRNVGEPLDRRRTARNLQAVLNNVDFQDPSRSVILYMALNPHGPLKLACYAGPNDPHFKDLSDWVYSINEGARSTVVASDPREQVVDRLAASDKTGASVGAEPVGVRPAKGGLMAGGDVARRGLGVPAADDDPEPQGTPVRPAPAAKQPARQRNLRDPYDPSAFNEQFAPKEKANPGPQGTP